MTDQAKPVVIKDWVVDKPLLQKKAIQRCIHDHCKAACCADGVWVDLVQAQLILDNASRIAPFMPVERRDATTWFVELHRDALAFPSGKYTGTSIVADPARPGCTSCVFLRPEDRYCAIHAASLAACQPAWILKPHYCCLFPLVDEYGPEATTRKLTLDEENSLFEQGGGCCEACEVTQPVFQVYAEETALVLGIDGYHELCEREAVTPRL